MDKKVYLASGPVCGRSLFRGSPDSYIEGGCPKCKNYLQISFTPEGVVCRAQSGQQNTEMPKR